MEHLGTFILNHWYLFLALVVILLLVYLNELFEQKKRAHELSPQAAVDKINHDEATVFDLRPKNEFMDGHIIDSIQANSADFEQKKMEKYKNKPLILTCAKGTQAAQTASKLREFGFANVYILQGGIDAWKKADLPLVKK